MEAPPAEENDRSFPLEYCPDGPRTLHRLRLLYRDRRQDLAFAAMGVPSGTLREFASRHAGGYCPRPSLEDRTAFWDRLLRERAGVEDDSVPSAYLSELDQGLYGGLVGGEVQFMAHPENGWISSMVKPILRDWSGFDELSIDRDGPWHRFYLRELEAFAAAAEGKFGISHFILIDGLNFLFELFGATRTYLEVLDNPGRVRQAMDFAHRLNREVQEEFFRRVGLLEGGTCSNMAQWLPGRVVSESVDPFHVTSVEYFERWGRGPVRRIFDAFDGGVLHLHANGRHLLEAVRSLRGLKAVYLMDDRGHPSAFSGLGALKRRAADVPLVVDVRWPEFAAALRERRLPGGVLYRVGGVPDVASANRCMEKLRRYRAPRPTA